MNLFQQIIAGIKGPAGEFSGVKFGLADASVAGADHQMPFGSGNTDANYVNERHETFVGSFPDLGYSVAQGGKVHERGGADIAPDNVNFATGNAEWHVPGGLDEGSTTRGAWNIDLYINPNADGGRGHVLGDDRGDIDGQIVITNLDTGQKAVYEMNDDNLFGGDIDWRGTNGATGNFGDETKDGFYSDSINEAFFDQDVGGSLLADNNYSITLETWHNTPIGPEYDLTSQTFIIHEDSGSLAY